MNSVDIWNLLKSLDTKDIKILISMSIKYLEEDREVNFKDIIKDIKECRKMFENK